jgi:hypothetical protein
MTLAHNGIGRLGFYAGTLRAQAGWHSQSPGFAKIESFVFC